MKQKNNLKGNGFELAYSTGEIVKLVIGCSYLKKFKVYFYPLIKTPAFEFPFHHASSGKIELLETLPIRRRHGTARR